MQKGTSMKETFNLTEAHIKMVCAYNIRWNDNSYDGAPEVDPKRPFGNSDWQDDLCELLEYEPDSEGEFTDEQYRDVTKLFESGHIALEIILQTRSFVPGKYEREQYFGDWKLVN